MNFKRNGRFRRLLKGTAALALVVVVVAGAAGFAMRGRIVAKVLMIAENRLAEQGVYIEHGSHALSWTRGVVLEDLGLFVDEAKRERFALFENVGFRVPLREIFSDDASLILSSDRGDLQLWTRAGDLRLNDIDCRFEVTRSSCQIDRFEADLKGLHLVGSGLLCRKQGDEKKELKLPDLSPLVKVASWLDFPAGRPRLALRIKPRDGTEGGVDLEGEFSGEDFRWKNVHIDNARATITQGDDAVGMPEVNIDCYGGNVNGGLVIDYRKGELKLTEINSTADPFRLIGAILGGDSLKGFRTLGKTSMSGRNMIFDLKDFTRSRGSLLVDSPGGLLVSFDSAQFPLKPFRGEARLAAGKLQVDGEQFSIFGGTGSGSYTMPLSGGFSYRLKTRMSGVSLAQAGKECGLEGELAGMMNLQFDGGGAAGIESHYGKGRVEVNDGELHKVPVLGSLRAFLSRQSKHFGRDGARHLTATFSVKDGKLHSPDLQVESVAAKVMAEGYLDFVRRTVSVDVRAKLKGVTGLAIGIVGRILEVHGEGPVDAVDWRMKVVPEGMGKSVKSVTKGAGGVLKGAGKAAGKLIPNKQDRINNREIRASGNPSP